MFDTRFKPVAYNKIENLNGNLRLPGVLHPFNSWCETFISSRLISWDDSDSLHLLCLLIMNTEQHRKLLWIITSSKSEILNLWMHIEHFEADEAHLKFCEVDSSSVFTRLSSSVYNKDDVKWKHQRFRKSLGSNLTSKRLDGWRRSCNRSWQRRSTEVLR